MTTTGHRAATGMRLIERRPSPTRNHRRRLDDRHWLLIGAIVFGLEVVAAVAVLQVVI